MIKSRVPNDAEASGRIAQILLSAASLFFEKGYAGTSTTQIAARAKASKHTLYQHFSSKEDLFIAVVTMQMDVVVEKFAILMNDDSPVRETLISVGAAVIKLMYQPQHMATAHIVQSEFQHFPEMSRMFYRLTTQRTIRQMALYLQEQDRRSALSVSDPKVASEQICNLMFGGVCQRRLMGVTTFTKRQELEMLEQNVDLFLRGLR